MKQKLAVSGLAVTGMGESNLSYWHRLDKKTELGALMEYSHNNDTKRQLSLGFEYEMDNDGKLKGLLNSTGKCQLGITQKLSDRISLLLTG